MLGSVLGEIWGHQTPEGGVSIRLIIDGSEVEVPPGTTVKEAARAAGIKIPGLCDREGLQPYGGCRLCLVEIEGMRGYPSSCTLPASEGMVVKTSTPALQELRRSILEMLLSEHPSSCIVCQRADSCEEIRECLRKVPQNMGCRYCPRDGSCELQETARLIGLDEMDLPRISLPKEIIRSPFFDRDPNLCILCGRCVRACPYGVLSFVHRGFEAAIATAFERPLEESGCRFCGYCLDACPTGALQERGNKWAGTAEKTVTTTCPYCSSNCEVVLEVRGERLLRSKPADGRLCVRGRFGLEFVSHRDRLKRPLVRKDGKLKETGWGEALTVAAEGLRRNAGPKFVLLTSGICTSESLYLSKRLARDVLKGEVWAPDAVATGLEGLKSPVLLVGDIEETNPALEQILEPEVVLTPWRTRLAGAAQIWLRPSLGGEVEMLTDLSRNLSGSKTSSGDISRAAELLRGGTVLLRPEWSPGVVDAARKVASATGGGLCILGRNFNSLGASALGLRPGWGIQAARSAYVIGCNPARSSPVLAESLEALDFLVVQDLFLTETAEMADVVLPASSFAEMEGTFLGSDGRFRKLRKATAAMGWPDWKITADIARRLGAEGFDFETSEAVEREIRALPRLDLDSKLVAAEETEVKKARTEEEFLIQALPSLYRFGTGTRTSRVFDLRYLCRGVWVEISPEDAWSMGLSPGDSLVLYSPLGRLKAKARISSKVYPKTLRVWRNPALQEIIPQEGVFLGRLDVSDNREGDSCSRAGPHADKCSSCGRKDAARTVCDN